MKLILIALLFTLLLLCSCERHVTQDLLEAQAELTVGHEFAEIFLVENRARLSNHLEYVEQGVLDYFMGAYAEIKNIGIATRERMSEFPETPCKDSVRARWELQIPRYGQKLSECLALTYGYLNQLTNILNNLHHESRTYSNAIPNSGVNVLSNLDIFVGRDNLQTYINSEFRQLLFRAFDRHAEFEEFIGEAEEDAVEFIRQLTACFRSLPRYFDNEAYQDLRSISECPV